MDYYRRTFLNTLVIPKLHMLEDHVDLKSGMVDLDWWGAESIHAYFKDPVDDKGTLILVHVVPGNIAARPPPLKRRKKSK